MSARFDEVLEAYIRSKAKSWSASTKKSEQSRLRGVTMEMLTKPETLWDYLTQERGLKAYAAKTAFIRAGEVLEYAIRKDLVRTSTNVLKAWMEENANLFKHAYKPKPVKVTFEDALEKIQSLEDEAVRAKALQLLMTGMRYEESFTLDDSGQVIGKGGGAREVPLGLKFKADFDMSRVTFWRHLKQVGLTPHMLRKLCATKSVELGAREAELLLKFGWKSVQVAASYVQASRMKELNDKFEAISAAAQTKKKEVKNGE